MSTLASQFTDAALPTVLGEVDSVDGVPFGKTLTRKKLRRIGRAMERFANVIAQTSPPDASGARAPADNKSPADGKSRLDASGDRAPAKGSRPEGPHCIVVTGGLGFRNGERTESTEEDVRNACYSRFDYLEKPRDITIHLVLDSGGGSLDTAFKIALILRRFATDIRVYVPRRAKSAATLLAIGADEIFMSPFGELGPLDTQIKDPRNPTKTVSALDCYQSVDYVQKFGLATLPKVLGVLLRETEARIPLSDLIETATDFALDEVTPILGQVNAVDFGGWGRTLKIGETYASALQGRRGYEDEKKIAEIAKRLVYDYPHHPYYIEYEEAKKIGLNVRLMTKAQYDTSLEIAEAAEGGRCVGFIEDIRAMERNAPVDEPMNGNGSQPSQQVEATAYDPEGAQPR